MAFQGDATDFELYMLKILEDIRMELRKINIYNREAMDFEIKDDDIGDT